MKLNSKTKVKVSVDALLEAVRARRAKEIAIHEQQVRDFEEKESGWAEIVALALDTVAATIRETGEVPSITGGYSYSAPSLFVSLPRDAFPKEPLSLDLTDLDRLIRTLEMAADETIQITADDVAQYLG